MSETSKLNIDTSPQPETVAKVEPPQPVWVIMPVLGARDYTMAAIADVLAQTVPTRLLIVNQGVDDAFREALERAAEYADERIFLWSHVPSLPSLAGTWNRALDYVWACGGDVALVVNNDVRLWSGMIATLQRVRLQTDALFVSCVGVTPADYEAIKGTIIAEPDINQRGGPDFSCFLISRAAHEKYRFDEGFIPAYGEDCDMHRRYMLGGDGQRIFSINVPFLHYASGTLKSLEPAARSKLERRIDGSRVYYAKKWGPGGINHETYTIPFTASSARERVTNPELQEVERIRTNG